MAATALSVLLLTTACSPGTDNDKNEGTGKKDVATGGKAFATADEETAKLGSDADPGAFPRSIEHANGTTDIAEKPQRVVVLDTGELDDVLSLGITPVGMVTTEGANPVPSYLADRVKGVDTVGTINELDLEAIAALEPDLILGSQLRADDPRDSRRLQKIRIGAHKGSSVRIGGSAPGVVSTGSVVGPGRRGSETPARSSES